MTAGNAEERRRELGVAAVEFAIVLPVLLLLFFGMVNLTNYVSMLRKASSAAELVADLVTRHNATIRKSSVDDYIAGAKLSFRPLSATGVNVEIHDYVVANGVATNRWTHPTTGTVCTPPDTSSPDITSLPNGDVIIAVVCIPVYTMPVDFPGIPQLGAIRKTVALRPRHSTTLLLIN